ncbi:hypothetical protein JHFBIEKO_4419 [Methylobacterium mesophilicum]|uniref:DUF6894 family protein n=1 Tax=Methylobacterium mesophilicum TaxID=39956 RepID=UPI001EE324C7|nr:hypothetical protein [Methylobacterium mesophilicum]GJE23953.1 hypothetical protein JHFBIEKO_4419 [Methylobacterium mesophilicum]
MPRFFFDTINGAGAIFDDEGEELPDAIIAKQMACTTLGEIMADMSRTEEAAQCQATVRDESGARLFTARLTLSVTDAT